MQDTPAPSTQTRRHTKHFLWALATVIAALAAAYAAAVTTASIASDVTVPPYINQWVTIGLGTSLCCAVILAGFRTIVGLPMRQLAANQEATQRQLIAEIGRLRMNERDTQRQLDELYGKGYMDGVAKRLRDNLN